MYCGSREVITNCALLSAFIIHGCHRYLHHMSRLLCVGASASRHLSLLRFGFHHLGGSQSLPESSSRFESSPVRPPHGSLAPTPLCLGSVRARRTRGGRPAPRQRAVTDRRTDGRTDGWGDARMHNLRQTLFCCSPGLFGRDRGPVKLEHKPRAWLEEAGLAGSGLRLPFPQLTAVPAAPARKT